MSNYTFIIVGKNDNPIYEAEFSSGQKVILFFKTYFISDDDLQLFIFILIIFVLAKR